jgi:uncharacterized protein YdhG (YjbR/CyaY superfamily)
MISNISTVDDYLAGLSPEDRALFTAIRRLFKKSSARIEESMKFRMPTYMIGAEMVGAFNRQKNYLSLYLNPAAVKPHREALGHLDCGKSCIRFRHPADLPLDVAEKVIHAAVKMAEKKNS